MVNPLLVTDTKFSSRERSRVGKYNRPPSLPASASLPSLLLRTLRPAAQRKNVAKAFSLPSFHVPSDKLPTWLLFYNLPPSLPPLFVRGHRWERRKSFSRRLGAKRPNPCRSLHYGRVLASPLCAFTPSIFITPVCGRVKCAYCVDSRAQVVNRIPLSKGCAHDGISNKERPPGLRKRPSRGLWNEEK